ncbi:MAG: hypothetical protein HY898_07180 [Deltaproteobacteria bacterium]|nr:hypothetical protein [Deltaproteobacteria bacterium]
MLRSSSVCAPLLVLFAGSCLVACGSDEASSSPVGAGGSGGSVDAAIDSASGAGGSAGSGGNAGTDSGAAGQGQDASNDAPAQDGSDAAVDSGPTCGRVPGPEDADRIAVVSHPYDTAGKKAEVYELLTLNAAGTLAYTGEKFNMGRSYMGNVVFTPDGKVGIVSQDEDGTLGSFRINAAGHAEVVQAKFKGGFYAGPIVMHPSGDRLYVLDSEWANIGGGVYSVRIGCDGTLTEEGKLIEAKLPYSLVPIPGKPGQAAIAAKDLLSSAAGDDAHLVTIEPSIQKLASADAFADDQQIIASGAATPDGKFVLFGDNNEYGTTPNRIAVLEVGDSTLTMKQMLPDMLDPLAILVSPYEDVAIVVSGYGNAIQVLKYDASNATTPFSLVGPLSYKGAKPQLPGGAVMVDRGTLKGRVLVAENEGVRMVQFAQGTGVSDLGVLPSGGGMEGMVGVVGVQP